MAYAQQTTTNCINQLPPLSPVSLRELAQQGPASTQAGDTEYDTVKGWK